MTILAAIATASLTTASLTIGICAHRGGGRIAPENTLAGIRAGAARGAALVEVDIRRTRDGILVLMHDDSVDRTTNGHGLVRDLTLQQLRCLDAGQRSVFGRRFAGERIPTLREALVLVRALPGVSIVLDVKDPADREEIQTAAFRAGMQDRHIMWDSSPQRRSTLAGRPIQISINERDGREAVRQNAGLWHYICTDDVEGAVKALKETKR